MGFSIVDPIEGPVVTFNLAQRRLIADATKRLGLALVVHGDECPSCLFAHVTRASVIHVMKTLAAKTPSIAAALDEDKVRWSSGRKTSEVLLVLTQTAISEMESLNSPVVEVWDNYKSCEHPQMKAVRRKRRTKPIE